MTDPAPPLTDPTVPQHGNRDGTEGDYSGQEPGSFANPKPILVDAGAVRGGAPVAAQASDDGPGSPEAGHRASIDPVTGAVHGSGSGAGSGAPGENFDSDSAGGDGAP